MGLDKAFCKNEDYTGAEDEYDFYFTDEYNHCIRILTPTGRVTTFAGRGNGSTEGGYADGALRTEARFFHPWAIAYDEKENVFMWVKEEKSMMEQNRLSFVK